MPTRTAINPQAFQLRIMTWNLAPVLAGTLVLRKQHVIYGRVVRKPAILKYVAVLNGQKLGLAPQTSPEPIGPAWRQRRSLDRSRHGLRAAPALNARLLSQARVRWFESWIAH